MSSIKKNFLLLMTLQISTYAVPLITLPLLTRALGPQSYGRLSFSAAVITYFISFANYSFDLTATPRIALAADDRRARSHIFWSILSAQILVAAIGFIVLLALTCAIDRFSLDRTLLLVGFGMPVGAALTPTWYFQGVQRLKAFSLVLFTCRALSIPAMFVLVHDPSDLISAMAINSAVPLCTGLVTVAYLLMHREVDIVPIRFNDVLDALRGGWGVFLASTSVAFFASTNTILLGFISGNVAAGYFAAADKLIRAAIGMLQPLKAACYPRINYLMHHAREDASLFLRKLLMVQGTMVFAISLSIFIAAPMAVKVFYGPRFAPTVCVLRWMAFIPLMAGMIDVFGVQTMLPLGMKTTFSRLLIASGLVNAVLVPLLAHFFAEQGAAAAVLIAEGALAFALALALHWRRESPYRPPAH